MRHLGNLLTSLDSQPPRQIRKATFLISSLLLVTACRLAPTPASPPTLVPKDTPQPTATANPTDIPRPTATTKPTEIPKPTDTPQPTATPAPPTPAPTVTPTWAPVPAVQEQISASNVDRLEKVYTQPGPEGSQWKASPDGKYVANVDERGSPFSIDITIYALQTGAAQAHLEKIHDFAFSPDGKQVAFASEDKTALVDLTTGTVQTVFDNNYGDYVVFSPDGTLVSTQENINASVPSSSIMLWDVATGKLRTKLERHHGGNVAFSPDSSLLACWTDPNTVTILDTRTGATRAAISSDQLTADAEGLRDLLFSPDGAILALRGTDQITLWRVQAATLQSVLKGQAKHDDYGGGDMALQTLKTMAFSPDGRLLASVYPDFTAQLWNVQTGAIQTILKGHASDIDQIAFSPDGAFLASAGKWTDSSVRLWDVQTGSSKLVDQDQNPVNFGIRPRVFAFSPNGALLATLSQSIPESGSGTSGVGTQGIRIWNTQTGQSQAAVVAHVGDEQNQLLFSPDGRLLVYMMGGNAATKGAGYLTVFGLISSTTNRAGVKISGNPPQAFQKAVPPAWLAVDPVPARYEMRFKNEYQTFLTCPYMGNNQVYYSAQAVTVTVIDLKTNQEVASQIFRGAQTAQCKSIENFPVGGGKYKYVSSDANADEFDQWLKATVTPLMP